MQTQTADRRGSRTTGPITVVAYAGAAAFVVASTWFWLATSGATVATAPRTGPDATSDLSMRIHYRWQVTTLAQERYYTSIAIAGFVCLAAAAVLLRDLLGDDRAPGRIGALLVGTGSLLWVAGAVLELGGHRAVGLMATHANPIQTTNAIAFTVDTIGQAFALAAFTLLGAGLLALAAAARWSGRGAWVNVTALTALVLLVTAGSYATGNDDFSHLMLLVGGVVVLPLWLVWTGRTCASPMLEAGE